MSNYARPSREGDSLREQLRAERARAAQLAAELVLERSKVEQLEQAYQHKDNEAWHQHETIETLKVEMRSIATLTAELQGRLLSAPPIPAPRLPAPAAAGTPAIRPAEPRGRGGPAGAARRAYGPGGAPATGRRAGPGRAEHPQSRRGPHQRARGAAGRRATAHLRPHLVPGQTLQAGSRSSSIAWHNRSPTPRPAAAIPRHVATDALPAGYRAGQVDRCGSPVEHRKSGGHACELVRIPRHVFCCTDSRRSRTTLDLPQYSRLRHPPGRPGARLAAQDAGPAASGPRPPGEYYMRVKHRAHNPELHTDPAIWCNADTRFVVNAYPVAAPLQIPSESPGE